MRLVVDIKYYISVIVHGGGETTVGAADGSRTRSIARAEDTILLLFIIIHRTGPSIFTRVQNLIIILLLTPSI